jgi:hypothetical protein
VRKTLGLIGLLLLVACGHKDAATFPFLSGAQSAGKSPAQENIDAQVYNFNKPYPDVVATTKKYFQGEGGWDEKDLGRSTIFTKTPGVSGGKKTVVLVSRGKADQNTTINLTTLDKWTAVIVTEYK